MLISTELRDNSFHLTTVPIKSCCVKEYLEILSEIFKYKANNAILLDILMTWAQYIILLSRCKYRGKNIAPMQHK